MWWTPRSQMGIAIEGNLLTWAYSRRRKSRWHPEKQDQIALPEGTTDERAAAFAHQIRAAGVVADASVLVFPQRKAIVKTLVLPATQAAEIRDMATLQAGRLLPLDPREMAVGCQRLAVLPDGRTRVMLAVIHREELRELLRFLSAAHVPPSRVVLASTCFREYLESQAVAPAALSSVSLAASQMPIAESYGLDFLSPQERHVGTRRIRRRAMGWALGAGLVGLFIVAGALAGPLRNRWALRRDLARESAQLATQTQSLDRMKRTLTRAQNRLRPGASFLGTVAELNRMLPEHVALRTLDYEEGRPLSLQGTCASLSDAVRAVETLQRSRLFSTVELRSSNVSHEGERTRVDFTLWCVPRETA